VSASVNADEEARPSHKTEEEALGTSITFPSRGPTGGDGRLCEQGGWGPPARRGGWCT